jgi:WD40 repeat protein
MRLSRKVSWALVVGVVAWPLAWLGWTLGRRPAAEAVPCSWPSRFLDLTGPVWAVAFAPDGRTLAWGGHGDGKVRLWDLADARERSILDLGGAVAVRPIAFNPGSDALIAGGNLSGRMQVHTPGVFSPPLRIWDVASGKQQAGIGVGPEDYLRGLRFSSDGRTLATSGVVASPAFGTLIRAPEWCEQITLWDTASWTQRSSFTLNPGQVMDTAFTPDLKTFVAVSADGSITLYDTAQGQPLRTFKTGRAWMSAALGPDGRTLALLSFGPSVVLQIRDLATGNSRESQAGREVGPGVVFAPDGRTLATTWSEPRSALERLPFGLGQMLSGASPESGIVLWDVATLRPRLRLKAPVRELLSDVAFAPDGRTVAVGGLYQVFVWEVPSDRPQVGKAVPITPASGSTR